MADPTLQVKRVSGNRYTAEDTLEVQFTYEGDIHTCVQTVNVVSGPTVTHGGGAAADVRLHYKAPERDADEHGIVDYSTTTMHVVQSAKGTSVVKIIADVVMKSDYDTFMAAYVEWRDAYVLSAHDNADWRLAEGAPAAPTYPAITSYESGQISLEWADDTFV